MTVPQQAGLEFKREQGTGTVQDASRSISVDDGSEEENVFAGPKDQGDYQRLNELQQPSCEALCLQAAELKSKLLKQAEELRRRRTTSQGSSQQTTAQLPLEQLGEQQHPQELLPQTQPQGAGEKRTREPAEQQQGQTGGDGSGGEDDMEHIGKGGCRRRWRKKATIDQLQSAQAPLTIQDVKQLPNGELSITAVVPHGTFQGEVALGLAKFIPQAGLL